MRGRLPVVYVMRPRSGPPIVSLTRIPGCEVLDVIRGFPDRLTTLDVPEVTESLNRIVRSHAKE